MRVLLVDDDPLIRESYALGLRVRGIEVVSADGRDGLSKIAAEGFEVAVVDMLMPDVDGVEFMVWSRAQAPRLRIIAISGGGAISADNCLTIADSLGAEATFHKPVDLDALAAAITTAA